MSSEIGGSANVQQMQPIAVPMATNGHSSTGYSAADSLAKSDVEVWIVVYDQANPMLPVPWLNPGTLSVLFESGGMQRIEFDTLEQKGGQLTSLKMLSYIMVQVEQKNHEMIMNVLNAWSDQIQKQSEEIREWLKSPAYQVWLQTVNPASRDKMILQFPEAFEIAVKGSAEFQTYLASLSPQQRQLELQQAVQREEGLRVSSTNLVDNYVQGVNKGDQTAFLALPLLASSLYIGGYWTGSFVEKAMSSTMGQALQGIQQQLPALLVDTTIMTINLFATGIMYAASGETLLRAASKGEKPVTSDVAKANAAETIMKVLGNQIPGALLAMLKDRLIGSTPVTHDQIAQLSNIAKVMLSLNALILLHQTAGDGNLDTLGEYLKGTKAFATGSLQASLVSLINQYRTELPPGLQQAILASMFTLLSKKPTFDDVLNPTHVLQDVLSGEHFDKYIDLLFTGG